MKQRSLKFFLSVALLVICGCKEDIAHNIAEQDLGKIIRELADAGIIADRERQGDGLWSVTVEHAKALQALQVLEGRRLLRKPEETKEENDFFSTDKEQQLKYERALSREIEKTLLVLDGILDAKVHLNLPASDSLSTGKQNRTPYEGTAAVLLIALPDIVVTEDEIRDLVSGASGVNRDKITVLVKPGNETPHEKFFIQEVSSQEQLNRWLLVIPISLVIIGLFLIHNSWPKKYIKDLDTGMNNAF